MNFAKRLILWNVIVFAYFSQNISAQYPVMSVTGIQTVPLGRDSSYYAGDTVRTGGLVVAGTGCYYAGTGVTFYIEDPSSGPFSGIMAYNPQREGFPQLVPGDSVLFDALVSEYVSAGPPFVTMTELFIVPGSFQYRTNNMPEPHPQEISASIIDSTANADSSGEQYEGVFVKVNGLTVDTVINYTTTSTWICSDSTGARICVREASDSIPNSFRPPRGTVLDFVQGVVYHRFGAYHLQPRYMRDVRIETNSPTISQVHHVPENPSSYDSVAVIASVIDESSIQSVQIYYRLNLGYWDNAPMSYVSGNEYVFMFDPFPYSTRVDYYIRAQDGSGNTAQEPYEAPFDYYTFGILPYGGPGAIMGRVINSYGLPVEGVYIHPIGTPYSDFTDNNGNYLIDSLGFGLYRIHISHPLYCDSIFGPIQTIPNDTVNLNMTIINSIRSFNLRAPANGTVLTDSQVQFAWSHTSSCDMGSEVSYILYWDDNSNFSSVDSVFSATDTTVAISNFQRATRFYWRVKAISPYTIDRYSGEIYSFYIDGYPTLPTILEPDDGAVVDSSCLLIWTLSSDPDSMDEITYSLQIDNDPSFVSPEVDVQGLEESQIVMDYVFAVRLSSLPGFQNISSGTTYWWRVKAIDPYQLTLGYTLGRDHFVYGIDTTNDAPFPPLSGFSPSNMEEVISLTPTLSWDDATDPDNSSDSLRYVCQVFTELPGASLDAKGGILYYAYDTTAYGVNRYIIDADSALIDNFLWVYRVKTLDPGGLMSDWSADQLFWTNHYNLPPEPFPLLAPPRGARQVDFTTRFSWDETYDFDPNSIITYSLEVSSDSLFRYHSFLRSGLVYTSLAVPTDSLIELGRVFWRVTATDDDSLSRLGGIPEGPRVLMILPPGDANANGVTNGIDVTFMVNYLKGLGPAPEPLLAGDANGNCTTNGIDVTYLVNYLKGIGGAPVRGSCGR